MTLKPIWKKQDEFGDWIFGMTAADVDKVTAGYACSRCLEEFIVDGLPARPEKCYVCGETVVPNLASRELGLVVVQNADWL